MSIIRLGISRCLLGDAVRYDGGGKPDAWLIRHLGPLVEWVRVCPELESGFGVPREAMHLEVPAEAPRLVTRKSRRDLTATLNAWCVERVNQLATDAAGLDGFVLKSRSPSCGLERVKLYGPQDTLQAATVSGLFAAELKRRFPQLPMEEEGRLQDEFLRESFLDRLFAGRRWNELCRRPVTAARLATFHRRHKLTLMGHAPGRYAEAGRLAANFSEAAVPEYHRLLLEILAEPSNRGLQCNMMMHIAGYYKDRLEGWEKRELLELFRAYREGEVARAAPLTLLRHYAQQYDIAWLLEQTVWETMTPVYQ